MDYLVYAHLQLGQDKKARAVIDEMAGVSGFTETFIAGPYALAASPARYTVERGDWKSAAELQVRPSPLAHVQAVTHFARALGAARSGQPQAAKADIGKLAELRDKLQQAKDAYWSGIVDIQWQVANAWVLHAEGKHAEALAGMAAAAACTSLSGAAEGSPAATRPAADRAVAASGLGSVHTMVRSRVLPPLCVTSMTRCRASTLRLSPRSTSNGRKMWSAQPSNGKAVTADVTIAVSQDDLLVRCTPPDKRLPSGSHATRGGL
jgi:hypothetical protein